MKQALQRYNRRLFLFRQAALIGLGRIATGGAQPRLTSNPFTLGVASGDPEPDGVVLWTRLAPDPLEGGGLGPVTLTTRWEVASDEGFRNIVRTGTAEAVPELAHSIHVEVSGLEPDRPYWYRFDTGGIASPVGRTWTAPPPDRHLEEFRFAFVSCQKYEDGFFTSLRHLASEDIRLAIHLGDYIYEGAASDGRPRRHNSLEIKTLDEYRNRYALYQSDEDLQAAQAAFPFAMAWDDHEVDNDYAGAISEDRVSPDLFLQRRAAAYQAYYEHMPLRLASLPMGPRMRLYRSLQAGALARFCLLDTRQYRTDQPCGAKNSPLCAEALNPEATLLGSHQREWLSRSLASSEAQWNIIGQQVLVAPVDRIAGPGEELSMDKWSGYVRERDNLLRLLHEGPVANPVILTGDIHSNWANDLHLNPEDVSSPHVAVELVGTSLSSGGDGGPRERRAEAVAAENPFVRYHNGQRGYVRVTLTNDLCRADYRVLDYVTRPGSPVRTSASFVVESGRARLERL